MIPKSGNRFSDKIMRKQRIYRSQRLHLNAGVASPGSTITEVVSPQRPHWRVILVGNFTTGLVAAAMA